MTTIKIKVYEKPKFTIQDALKIQNEQLVEWQPKLSTELYLALLTAVIESNKGKTQPYQIARGTNLDNFIANWRPGRDIKELSWTLSN